LKINQTFTQKEHWLIFENVTFFTSKVYQINEELNEKNQ
jgi:hypothetical protein